MLVADEASADFLSAVHVDFTSGIGLLDLFSICDQIVAAPVSAGPQAVAYEDPLEWF